MESLESQQQNQELAKKVRILTKKLARSEADRRQLENASQERETILKNVIQELERSQTDLETALVNLTNLQVKLVESEKMSALGIMVGGIAHEINNPVGFIYGNLSHAQAYLENLFTLIDSFKQHFPQLPNEILSLMEQIDLEFIQQDYPQLFKSMNMGVERISEIVQSLKKFSRLDEADFKKQIDIHEDIENTLVILNHRFQPSRLFPHGIKLIKNFHSLPLIECYPSQLNQVFMNMLVNAIDALEDHYHKFITTQTSKSADITINSFPTIQITTYKLDDEWVAIEIIDNGVGIPAEIHSKLFDPFFTTKSVGKGTGLGLSICYQIIVQQHHGSINCESTPKNGTKFILKIPIRQV